MNYSTDFPYNHYEEALACQDFFTAIEMLKQYVSQNPQAAMEWYWLGYTLMRIRLYAQAGLYLRRALREFEGQETAEVYITKASIYALLQEKDICMHHIHTALWINPALLDNLPQDITLQGFLQTQDWDNIYAIQNIRNCQAYLTKNSWEAMPRMPEKNFLFQAVFHKNPYWILHLAYEPLERQCSLKLQNIQDTHIYHFRPQADSFAWLGVLTNCQYTITDKQWSELSESLIEVCEAVTWEMPDGRRIKIG